MEFTDVVRARRMVRNYDPDRPIPRELVDTMLNLAVRAPSAGHTQGWRFLVLDDAGSRAAFWAATSEGAADRWRTGMQRAPVLVVCFADRDAYLDRYAEADKGWTDRDEARWPVPYWHVDTGMAALILLLAAQDEGLGACLFGVPPDRWPALFDAFDVTPGLAPVCVVSLGHRAPDSRSPSLKRGRQALDAVRSYGRFAPLDGAAPSE